MIQPELSQELSELYASREVFEAQRGLLSDDIINTAIEQVNAKIAERIPAPTELQLQQYASWQTFVETAQALKLDIGEAPEDVAESIAAVEHYNFLKTLGSATVEPAAKVVKVPEPAAPAPIVPPVSAPAPDVQPKSEPSKEVQAVPVTITDGKETFEPQESTREMYTKVLKALADAPDSSLEIASFLREQTGASPTELSLHLSGEKLIAGLAADEAQRIKAVHKQLYTVVRTMKSHNWLDHVSGRSGVSGQGGMTVSGKIIAQVPIQVNQTENQVTFELGRRPYGVTLNKYNQTIDNGRGKKIEMLREPENFDRIGRLLGTVAVSAEAGLGKFARANMQAWLKDREGLDLTEGQMGVVIRDLKKIDEEFKGNFPLEIRGKGAGTRYQWVEGSEVEIVDGWPEKPNFDQPACVRFDGLKIYVTIDNVEHVLFDYDNQAMEQFFAKNGADRDAIVQEYRHVFECLSHFDESYVATPNELAPQTVGSDKISRDSFVNRLRRIASKLNEVSDEPIVNWRNQSGVLIDLNRSIVIDEEGTQSPKAEPATEPANPEPVIAAEQPAPERIDPLEVMPPAPDPEVIAKQPVDKRASAHDIVARMYELDQRTQDAIEGRLVMHGRFEYPKSLEEAAYLLSKLSDPAVMAKARESGRFPIHDSTAYEDFVTEAMIACYMRTRSWGSFTELVDVVTADHQVRDKSGKRDAEFKQFAQRAHDFVRDVESQKAEANRENSANRLFMSQALDELIAGRVPTPTNPYQAVSLLELIQVNRAEVVRGKTKGEFEEMLSTAHGYARELLGIGNFFTLIDSRQAKYTTTKGREVLLTSTGEELAMRHTDAIRHPTHSGKPRRRRRRR